LKEPRVAFGVAGVPGHLPVGDHLRDGLIPFLQLAYTSLFVGLTTGAHPPALTIALERVGCSA
jgi:hypothetical protein